MPNVTMYVSDGTATVSQSFDVLVAPANHPPSLTLPPDRIVRQGDGFVLFFAGSDPDGGKVTYTSSNLPPGAVLDQNTGRFQWTPGYDQAGAFAVPVTVTSSTGLTITKTITFTVLATPVAPVFDPQTGWTVDEGQSLTFTTHAVDPDKPNFVLPTRNPDGTLNPPGAVSPITYSVSGLPRGAAYDPATADFSWVPDYTQAGNYTITVTATDDDADDTTPLTAQVSIPITVRNVNRPPQITPVGNLTLSRGQVLDVPVKVVDPDGDPVTLTATNALTNQPFPRFGTFTDNGDGTGVFHFAPGTGDRGNYSITLTATDNGDGDGSGAVLSANDTFVVTVVSLNDPPVLAAVNGQVALAGSAFTLTAKASDIDQDKLTYSLSGLPAEAALTPGVSYGTANLNWTPSANEVGSYNVTIGVTDDGDGGSSPPLSDSKTFTLIVRSTDQAPVVSAVTGPTVAEGAPLNLQLQATDADGDPVTWSATGLPLGAVMDPISGQLRWTPAYGQAGAYPMTVTASDGSMSGSASFTITATHTDLTPRLVPVPPQYGRENTLLVFSVVGSDADGDAVQYTADNLPLGATFNAASGVFSWTPDYTQAGDYVVTFHLTDPAGLTATTQVRIHIDNVDRPPVLSIADHQAILGQTLTFSAAGTDPDTGDVLTYSAQGLPDGATIDPKTGLVAWTPGPAQAGDYVVRFSASDGVLTTSQNTYIHAAVTPTLPSVTIVMTPSFPVTQGTAVTVHALASSVAPIASISLALDGVPLTLDSTGTAQVIAGAPGKMTLQASATDADGLTATTTATLKVRDPHDTNAPAVALDPNLGLSAAHGSDPYPWHRGRHQFGFVVAPIGGSR